MVGGGCRWGRAFAFPFFIRFLTRLPPCLFADNVDTLTKPCKKLWTPSMAAAAYGQVEDFCANNIVYGTKQLCKSVGETDCVVV